jgi:hypothetical protein
MEMGRRLEILLGPVFELSLDQQTETVSGLHSDRPRAPVWEKCLANQSEAVLASVLEQCWVVRWEIKMEVAWESNLVSLKAKVSEKYSGTRWAVMWVLELASQSLKLWASLMD